MANDEIVNYIKSELARGESKEIIINSLKSAGWQITEIEDAFNAIPAPASFTATPATATNELVTEKDYPITKLWVFKAPIIIIVISIVAFLLGYWYPLLLIALPILLIINPLTRANFHYATREKFFEVREGFISKKQRNLPYGVIQDIFVKQDLFDRIFGLASLRIENASMAGGGQRVRWWNKGYGSKSGGYGPQEGLGSFGNKVNIPGMKKNSAEALKAILLQKIKENPIEESGL